jgi:V/A-type H+-transporting ATPase subunit K
MIIKITLIIALLLSIVIPFGAYAIGEKSRGRYKKYLALNVATFFGVLIFGIIYGYTDTVMAAEAVADTVNSSGFATGMGYIAAALSTGCSCIGGGIAVASAASAALGAISEDQSILGKSLIFVGLAEGVALYGLIISFMILGKL